MKSIQNINTTIVRFNTNRKKIIMLNDELIDDIGDSIEIINWRLSEDDNREFLESLGFNIMKDDKMEMMNILHNGGLL